MTVGGGLGGNVDNGAVWIRWQGGNEAVTNHDADRNTACKAARKEPAPRGVALLRHTGVSEENGSSGAGETVVAFVGAGPHVHLVMVQSCRCCWRTGRLPEMSTARRSHRSRAEVFGASDVTGSTRSRVRPDIGHKLAWDCRRRARMQMSQCRWPQVDGSGR